MLQTLPFSFTHFHKQNNGHSLGSVSCSETPQHAEKCRTISRSRLKQQHFLSNPEIKSCISISNGCLMHPSPLSTNMSVYKILTGAALQLCSRESARSGSVCDSGYSQFCNLRSEVRPKKLITPQLLADPGSWRHFPAHFGSRYCSSSYCEKKDHEECDFTTISDVWLLASAPMSVAEREVNKLRGEWWKLALP